MTVSKYKSNKLSAAGIREILLDRKTPKTELAEKWGVGEKAVYDIQVGNTYIDMYPDIPRRIVEPDQVSCLNCIHNLKNYCTMEFPEFKKGRNKAAANCAAYVNKNHPKTRNGLS